MLKQNWLNWRKLLIDDRRLTFGEKSIGLYLNTYMNDSHDFAFPSIATICGEMDLSNKTAIKYIAGLAEKGYLQKTKRFSNSTIYHATIPSCVKSTLMEDLHHRSVNTTLTEVYEVHSNKQENKQSNKQVKEKYKKKAPLFTAPTLPQVEEYALSRECLNLAKEFYDYFDAGDWHDSYGKKVKNWKQKFITWQKRAEKNETHKQTNKPKSNHEQFWDRTIKRLEASG